MPRYLLAVLYAALCYGSAWAEAWPERPVKLVVPYPPGGATDLVARPWAEALSKALGQQFVIDSRGGASGAIGVEAVAKSPPDGYTFLLTPSGPLVVLPHARKVAYDPVQSFTPVARAGDIVCGFVVHPAVGVHSLPELIAYAKQHPGQLAFASPGTGTSIHLRLEMLKQRTGVDILHVPYRGTGDALNDMLSGTVQLMNEIAVLPHVQAGKLILLNVNYPVRSPDFPAVPTLQELGIAGADVPIWFSFLAPAGTPAAIVDRLNQAVVAIARSAAMQAKMRQIQVIVPLQTPAEIGQFLRDDLKANGELIKAANIRLD